MNIFKLKLGDPTDLITQIVRLGPPTAKICAIEIDSPNHMELARTVVDLLADHRNSDVAERVVQGYQIGADEANRTTLYRMFFME